MNRIILCPKRTGNTIKLCKSVADKIKCDIKTIDQNNQVNINNYDQIILASGVYAGQVHKNIINWIEHLDNTKFENNKIFILLLTWIGRASSDKQAYNSVKKLFDEKGLILQENYMSCFGKAFGFIKRKHPNEQDVNKSIEWINASNK